MENNSKYEQLKKAVGGFKESSWLQEAGQRESSKKWLRRSQKVALLVLRTLRQKNISQKELAERMGSSPQLVNKWLKGNENFTFETIIKLENALGIELMTVGVPEKKEVIFSNTFNYHQNYKFKMIAASPYVETKMTKVIKFQPTELKQVYAY